jgi:HAD superfamily hydrolase (TIGR01490 family)
VETKAGIAFWDFDGTITKSDSLWHFLYFSQALYRLGLGAMAFSPTLMGMYLGRISNVEAKLEILDFFFGGWELSRYDSICQAFAEKKLPQLIRPEANRKLDWHRQRGHELVLVSASLSDYLEPWCQNQEMGLLATTLERRNGHLVAAYSQPNCYGPEKARRILERYNLAQYQEVYAYGNSQGDLEMLKLANHAFYKPF